MRRTFKGELQQSLEARLSEVMKYANSSSKFHKKAYWLGQAKLICERLEKVIGGEEVEAYEVPNQSVKAHEILQAGAGHLEDRAVTYDQPGGERSMARTVELFNLFYGLNLTEEQGWRFMVFLKMVRSTQGAFKLDNHEDACAYEALAAECLANQDKSK